MLDYALLDALAAVVRHGSFERAAGALNVTPSAVSQRVKLLEERVGAVLVKRGQPCVATAAGALLCRHTERVQLLEAELGGGMPTVAGRRRHGPPCASPSTTTVWAPGSSTPWRRFASNAASCSIS
ncbi:regulatory helix-turn-helix LysR family protein [Paraburkholderia eburnea]|uniref:Regulatory helix-turn-helix LysR family protein n=1 Tax=Paraburkholderia eburnea TaxID=1189126 RepID=A0A2S4M367_9BURK|nr:regulatory helix-turn-helix LysR family protein [Paraburkholderia eburnea]PRZ19529.1 regulatory helix-turn-helix LysR family protein [Paraburkholderia eburnea]